ncbi:MAG: metallophosphoesterase [Planctomycetales bacterium]|nr:metallophosphoesterase [Planctomycetales bacterium]
MNDFYTRRQFAGAAAAGLLVGTRALTSSPRAHAADGDAPRRRTLRVAHLTDVHVQPERDAPAGFAKALRHVQSLADPPEMIINGGDAIMDGLEVGAARLDEQWKLWQSVLKEECSLPVQHVIGNHDVWGWNKKRSGTTSDEPGWGKQRTLDELGLDARYRSFDAGGWHFVVLDSIFPDDENAYIARIDEQQWDWLAGDLKASPADVPIGIVSHIPILSVATVEFEPYFVEKPGLRRSISHTDQWRFVELFRRHANIKLCLSGHLHLLERIDYAGITYICTGAVSGNWWKGNLLHVDEGYGLVDFYDDGSFEHQYVPYGWEVNES